MRPSTPTVTHARRFSLLRTCQAANQPTLALLLMLLFSSEATGLFAQVPNQRAQSGGGARSAVINGATAAQADGSQVSWQTPPGQGIDAGYEQLGYPSVSNANSGYPVTTASSISQQPTSQQPTSREPSPQQPPSISGSQSRPLRNLSAGDLVPEQTAQKTPLGVASADTAVKKRQPTSTLQMIVSVGSSLLIVVGLFLGVAWCYRKSMTASLSGGLPKHVVKVLGKTPLAARQQLVLVRFGSKLVLVSMVQGEARTISEITDPLEVDQLVGHCESSQPGSISQSFRSVLAQGASS